MLLKVKSLRIAGFNVCFQSKKRLSDDAVYRLRNTVETPGAIAANGVSELDAGAIVYVEELPGHVAIHTHQTQRSEPTAKSQDNRGIHHSDREMHHARVFAEVFAKATLRPGIDMQATSLTRDRMSGTPPPIDFRNGGLPHHRTRRIDGRFIDGGKTARLGIEYGGAGRPGARAKK